MCLRPQTIRNPLYLRKSYASEFGQIVQVPGHLTPKDEFITVPCGKCADCRSSYYSSLVQRGIGESLSSYLYFVSLTYDNAHLPSLSLPNGQVIYFSEYNDIQNMFKRFRDANLLDREFRYLCVNEYGDRNSRPHFHLIIFVGKKISDSKTTPFHIESILKKNLGRFFAINLGTRKNPIYEPLFTFASKATPYGIKTNYFVKYVDPENPYQYLVEDRETIYVKTLRYLIGYVNKGSSFDSTIEHFLEEYKDDLSLCSRLRYILSSRVRYSKGFGFGFVDGYKSYIPRTSVRSSWLSLYFRQLKDSLPSTFASFADLYPHQVDMLISWIHFDKYKFYRSYQDFRARLDHDSAYLHFLTVLYFPRYFSWVYKTYWKDSPLSSPKISYFFDHRQYRYYQINIKSSDVIEVHNSPVYAYIRKGVEEGIAAAVPFLAFKMNSSQSFTALCKFYRERCCTLDDLQRMFDSIGVANFEEWQSKVEFSNSLRRANLVNSNKIRHWSEEKILKIQKNCLSLHRSYEGDNFYRYLYNKL